jgi:hypothetical protein
VSVLKWGALSDGRMGLLFTIAAGYRQCSHSHVRVPWDSQSYFTISDSRLPFLSPPTTRRATVEVFEPASTRDASCESITYPVIIRCEPETKHTVKRFVCCNLPIRCHGNACLPNRCPATVYSKLCRKPLFIPM